MWIPDSAEEIEQAAKRGDLVETPTFDAKVQPLSVRTTRSLRSMWRR